MANRRILELEATLKDTTSLAESSSEVADLKKSLNRATARYEEESTRTKIQLEESRKRLENAGKSICNVRWVFWFKSNLFVFLERQIAEKETLLAAKASEINAIEERYVQYLEKAKLVLRQMDPRNSNSISNQEIQSLKKQLDEKERRLKDLEVREKDFSKILLMEQENCFRSF